MLRNHLKFAWRNLWKNKTYSFINVFGLAVGMLSFLLIALYVFDELTYDRFHSNASNIYRVVDNKVSADAKESRVAGIGYKISEQAPLVIPGVKKAARFTGFGRANVSDPSSVNTFYEQFYTANTDFLTLFDFQLLEGNRASALSDPRSVIISESLARKIYGISSVTGKTLKIDRDTLPYTITGVLREFPSNSHFSLNLVFSESSITGRNYLDFIASDWNSNSFATYLLLDKEADVDITTQKLNNLLSVNRRNDNSGSSTLSLQPLADIHFNSEGIETITVERRGNLSYIYVFSMVALFVLLIACINYMNLTTARFSSRGKEIAVRKVAGAMRGNLIRQFLSEAFVIAIIALFISLATAKLLLRAFNRFTEKQLQLDAGTDPRIWIGIIVTVCIVGLFAGAYPALFQSRLKPFQLLKSKFQPGKGHLSLRKGLVVLQFALSIIMIVATIVVFLQMKYVNTTDMGFNKEQLLVVDINSGAVRRGAETIKTEYAKLPSVKSVSVSSRVPGEWKVLPQVKARKQGSNETSGDMFFMAADDQFLKTFEVQLVNGRNFHNNPADSSAIILNETAAKLLNITAASEQLVEIPTVSFSGNANNLDQPFKAKVIGITKDFNFRSLREKVAPLVLAYQTNPIHNIDYFTIRLSTADADQTLEQLVSTLHKVDAGHLFEYNFLDKQWETFYREDKKRQTIFLAIAILTILIACLGLFGLATYAAEQRVKEIGIRKVLGAKVTGLVSLLSKEFIFLVIIASIIATPFAWWMMSGWLKDFAYRTPMHWWIFLAAASVALFIALCTVGLKALKAAMVNPVKSLRNE